MIKTIVSNYATIVYLALAYIYKTQGQIEQANQYLALSAEIDNTEAMFFLGKSYLASNQPYHGLKISLTKNVFLNKI
ncbi:tetratricopeptide repeat protein [Francisella tularensis]|uniref:tetratricopeptide repeat protein n=1 Tax=Francisella tularensis TaxID=263 RepID=UPI001E54D2F7|nr:hypothetical protein [Francisella tularensis]